MKRRECKDLTGISRIGQKSTHCWLVRLGYQSRKPAIQKCFSDGKYGGMTQSFAAAIAFRDASISLCSGRKFLNRRKRTSSESRHLQELHGKRPVFVGTGEKASAKAHSLGLGKVTCWKVQTGRQNFVTPNHGGWRTAKFQSHGFKRDITIELEQKLRSMVSARTSDLSSLEESEIVGEILLEISTSQNEYNLNKLVCGWVRAYRSRKFDRSRHKHLRLDIAGSGTESDFYDGPAPIKLDLNYLAERHPFPDPDDAASEDPANFEIGLSN